MRICYQLNICYHIENSVKHLKITEENPTVFASYQKSYNHYKYFEKSVLENDFSRKFLANFHTFAYFQSID